MKNLFAAASYSFSNFYNNLNTQGQMVFSIIIFLIVLLCVLLFITYIIQDIKNKASIRKIKKNKQSLNIESKEPQKESKVEEQEALKEIIENEPLYTKEATEIENIASAIESAMVEDTSFSISKFEEDQEKTAIISIDELVKKAKELEIVDDDNGNVNYLEKYNLEPVEVEETINKITPSNDDHEVKAFKVSQIISPIYGVKKEVLENNNNIRS